MVVLNAHFVTRLFPSKLVLARLMCKCDEGDLNNLVQVLTVTDDPEILAKELERYIQIYREEDLVMLGTPRSIIAVEEEDEGMEIPLSPDEAAKFFRDMTEKYNKEGN